MSSGERLFVAAERLYLAPRPEPLISREEQDVRGALRNAAGNHRHRQTAGRARTHAHTPQVMATVSQKHDVHAAAAAFKAE